MFSSEKDHSRYLIENDVDYYERPGFPYFRFNKQINKEAEENLFLVMHGKSSKFLVMSNKQVIIYKLPVKASFLKRAVGTGIGMIPVVGDVLDGIDNAKDVRSGALGLKGWITGSKKRENKQKELDGMPLKKDYKNVEYKLSDPNNLSLISCYRDNILLANGFEWKTSYKTKQEKDLPNSILVTADLGGLSIENAKQKTRFSFSNKSNDFFNLFKDSVQENLGNFEACGWKLNDMGDQFVLEN